MQEQHGMKMNSKELLLVAFYSANVNSKRLGKLKLAIGERKIIVISINTKHGATAKFLSLL